ncbi:MAG: deoxyribonuclease IV [Elusimicrobia bacterium]|nr:deoxyribonuclease IV [Elusimicrobiota bacterium]
MRLGTHIWIGRGLASVFQISEALGCECFQIFLQNPRSWSRKQRSDAEIDVFRQGVKRQNVFPVVVHMPYLLNLSSPDKNILQKSRTLFEHEMIEAAQLGADYYVIHPGSHKGEGIETGVRNLIQSIKPFIGEKPKILLENTAGQGNTIGGKWEDFIPLFERYGNDIGLCFDTAHAFQSGYDIRRATILLEMLDNIDRKLAPNNVLLIHSNDSPSGLGSHLDRHQNIGEGLLGIKTFDMLIRNKTLGKLPFILETPKSDIDADKKNLAVLRQIWEKQKT